jgi:methyl-accepting chemotaxis protein
MAVNSLQAKYTLMLSVVTLVFTAIVVIIVSVNSSRSIQTDADTQVRNKLDEAIRLLELTDTFKTEQVNSAMALLKERGMALGNAALGDDVMVGSKKVPNLMLGDKPQANNYELVDGIADIAGGTATLFTLSGAEFVRVSTNVMKNNQRAIGTILSPDGLAVKAIRNNQPFYGQVDILGSPYLTGYEPIYDNAKKQWVFGMLATKQI